jgi:hypothetical protein
VCWLMLSCCLLGAPRRRGPAREGGGRWLRTGGGASASMQHPRSGPSGASRPGRPRPPAAPLATRTTCQQHAHLVQGLTGERTLPSDRRPSRSATKRPRRGKGWQDCWLNDHGHGGLGGCWPTEVAQDLRWQRGFAQCAPACHGMSLQVPPIGAGSHPGLAIVEQVWPAMVPPRPRPLHVMTPRP